MKSCVDGPFARIFWRAALGGLPSCVRPVDAVRKENGVEVNKGVLRGITECLRFSRSRTPIGASASESERRDITAHVLPTLCVSSRTSASFRSDPSREVRRMQSASLTLKSITARPVVLKLKRPVVARIGTITDWPLILIDLYTEEGIIGRSYLEPYITKSMRYLVPAIHDLGAQLKGHRVSPVELYGLARRSLHFVGYQGLSMIVVSGLDMAAWDALAKAAGMPLCVLLGGSVGPVKAYNSNGLWLGEPAATAAEAVELRDEGGFAGLKLRLGRE
jgi:hypothetical protein